ncbi:ARMT1-like domain-containing protein [Ignicoccus hospitalis]|uniref:Damage-control phosphatase ARMT1-like metal-binding domain-containing protein n=1 Tax=Ignicoccus hospitalis (strain KIN4/I / DSM 18386 / JCM 14125) TaxID=453591 RepID=A8A8M9_IGNH4|nr:ARMT1-like domain-containing protein [Ignicoccus hospitalis]ABU81281.1 protein of unknown function DUF89 [Ignicoccus hospitalis KIN4/I]
MKWREECVRCLLDARIYDSFKGGATDKELQFILSATVGSMQLPKSKAFRFSWKALKSVVGNVYALEKKRLLEETLSRELKVPQTFEEALRMATLGNLYDTAVGGEYRLGKVKYGTLVTEGAEVLLNPAGTLVYAVDNLPELPYDIMVAKYFKYMGWDVILVAREEDYEIDATYPELAEVAQLLGWDGKLDSLPGDCTIFDPCEDAKRLRRESDLVFAKGLLNADAYVDYKPSEPAVLAYAAKCKPLAEAVGAEIGDGVVVLGEVLLRSFRR